jgi:hypothetical protein
MTRFSNSLTAPSICRINRRTDERTENLTGRLLSLHFGYITRFHEFP